MNRRGFFALLGAAIFGRKWATAIFGRKLLAPEAVGISIRMVRHYEGGDIWRTRMDVLYGFSAIQSELSCRIEG
jgi:hypothetical protein